MSHLATIIVRFNRRLNDVYDGDTSRACKDSLWLQSIRNLREYQEAWTDQTPKEVEEANRIYQLYRHFLPMRDNVSIKLK